MTKVPTRLTHGRPSTTPHRRTSSELRLTSKRRRTAVLEKDVQLFAGSYRASTVDWLEARFWSKRTPTRSATPAE